MQFIYHENSGSNQLNIVDDSYRHIFKSRRQKKESILYFRNLHDEFLYSYKIDNIDKKSALLSLLDKQQTNTTVTKKLHIAWCVIDPKEIEKTLPILNEIGVSDITFIYCQNSQQSYKLDFERFNRILINSSQQSGRASIINIHNNTTLEKFLEQYPKSYAIDFDGENILQQNISSVIVGCEGGFSSSEKELFNKKLKLNSNTILKSTSATISISAKVLL